MKAATASACFELESKLTGVNQRTTGTAIVKILPRIFRVESLASSAPSNCATDRATVVISVFLLGQLPFLQHALGAEARRARATLFPGRSLSARRGSCPTLLPQRAGLRDLIPPPGESL